MNKKTLLCLSLLLLFLQTAPGQERPKNIILLIGDGMGLSHITALQTIKGNTQMERMPVGGFLLTHSESSYVTDSAAGGTALATGSKTKNGYVSVDPKGRNLETVLESAERRGMATGLVATCRITHATPASFASHSESRNSEADIALQIAHSDVEVLFGGGLDFFLPNTVEGSKRPDTLDLTAILKARYPMALDRKQFFELKRPMGAYGFFAMGHLPGAAERTVSLAEMTRKAIEILSQDPEGFFLMVEGSQIDWAAHENNMKGIEEEMLDFDKAIGEVLDFAKNSETLVIVTADHETGGLTLIQGNLAKRTVEPAFSTKSHTGSMVPLLAYGPGSGLFGGIHDNTHVGKTIKELLK